jgi:DNA mismatch repair protein MutS2
MQAMVEHTTEKSLFLMDELGAGTDPQYGGAIAEALLEFLASKPTCGLVTTHFGNLKRLSEKYPSIENGAMLFDEKEMRPRYQLKTGQSGTSFTFEMAEKIGLDKAIIRQAIGKVGRMQIQYEKLLRKMERKQLELDKQQKMMEFTDTQLAALIQQYTTKNVELKQKRIEIIKEARNEAKMLVRDTNKLIEKTVREVRESNADKEVIKTLRKEIEQFTHEIEQKEKQETEAIPVVEQPPIEAEAVQLHDMVLLQDTHTVGEVTFMDNKDIIVSFNSINLKTTLDKVQKISNAQQKKLNKSYTKEIYASLATKVENFKLQLDLRGMRAPDALAELGRYLDDALLLSIHKVRILHGKGNGILRMIVREYLAKDKQVTAFYDESPEHGGHGITVVEMD